VGWQINPNELESTYSPVQREKLSRFYSNVATIFLSRGDNKTAMKFAKWASDLWEGNGEAYLTLAYLAKTELMRTEYIGLAVESFRKQVKSGRDVKESLALALTILASRQVDGIDSLVGFYSKFHTLKGDNLKIVEGLFEGASAEVGEALGYNAHLVDALALRILIEAKRTIFIEEIEAHGARPSIVVVIEQAKELCRQFPNSAIALETLSTLMQLSGKYDEAIKNVDAAIEIEPYNVRLFLDRAQIEMSSGDCSRARNDLKKAADLAGDEASDIDFALLSSFTEGNKCGSLEPQ
jgi:tetratricopeptide (TPR) repeat protein